MKKVIDNMQGAMYSVGVASNKRHNTTQHNTQYENKHQNTATPSQSNQHFDSLTSYALHDGRR